MSSVVIKAEAPVIGKRMHLDEQDVRNTEDLLPLDTRVAA